MSDTVIQVEGIGKRYRIGRPVSNQTFREAIMSAARSPFQRVRNPVNTGGDEVFWALKDISFEVKRGEVVGIIGRNGAGKSTLLKILSRITEPTQGQVVIQGRVGSLLEVGTGFHPELTGRENIYLNGAILGMKRGEIERQLDAIIAFSGVEKFLDTPVKHYSSGMSMRLAFAVAAHLNPEILVIDEVLAVGDAEFQEKCLGKMQEVAQGGRTVLFVSHNMSAVENLCSRVVMLHKGRVSRDDTRVQEVVREYIVGDRDANRSGHWKNSGHEFENPWFKPLRVGFYDAGGEPVGMPVNNRTPNVLEIEAEISRLDPTMTVGVGVYSENGELLFQSFNIDGIQNSWTKPVLGRQTFRVTIPPRLFNEGVYRFELIVTRYNDKWVLCPGREGPPVYLSIQGGLSDSPVWIERRPGLLAPVLEWDQGK